MTSTQTRRSRRWAMPTVAALVVAGGVGYGAVAAMAGSGLPEKSAQEILTGMQQAQMQPLAGTVVAKADLGLPEIPGTSDSPEFMSLVSGSHTLRVWYGGPDKVRLAKLGDAGETNVIRNGTDAWMWSSAQRKAVHHTLPADTPQGHAPTGDGTHPKLPSTPEDAARQVLDQLDTTSTVTTTSVSRVAGRDAYELVVTPDQDDTLVRDVRIAVDGETMLPLRVQINSTKLDAPAYEVGFTSLEFGEVEDRMFAFTPPAGTTVEEGAAPSDHDAQGSQDGARTHHERGTAGKGDHGEDVAVVGEGWSRVYVLPMDATAMVAGTDESSRGGHGAPSVDADLVLSSLPTASGDWGSGRVLDGTLFSVVITDTRVALGAVGADTLTAALAESGR